ncbi:MAG: hypothetical protein J0H83_16645 [Candidatus Melainabacteria bacterium]|nr:hypothetical protein [Candidatus Melainabacteria bacterium]
MNQITRPFNKRSLVSLGCCLVPALLTFATTLYCNLRVLPHYGLTFADSSVYMNATRQLWFVWKAICFKNWPVVETLLYEPTFVSKFAIDGPILPTLGAAIFTLTGQDASFVSWPYIIICMALFNAIVCGVISYFAARIFKNIFIGLVLGLAWLFYIPAILNAGRYLTEPVAACLSCLCALTMYLAMSAAARSYAINRKILDSIVLGLCQGLLAGAGLLLKPALGPVFALPILLVAIFRSVDKAWRVRFVSAALVVAALFPLSWALYAQRAIGQFQLVPQRMPVFNMAIGNGLVADGYTITGKDVEAERLVSTGSALGVLKQVWTDSPLAIADLYLRKISRLCYAWNDFKYSLFGCNIDTQNAWQAFVLIFAFAGACISVLQLRRLYISHQQMFGLIGYSLFAAGFNLAVYVPFESCPRYYFGAMPFVFLLAMYGAIGILDAPRLWVRLVALAVAVLAWGIWVTGCSGLAQVMPLGLAQTAVAVMQAVLVIGFTVMIVLAQGQRDGRFLYPEICVVSAFAFFAVLAPSIVCALDTKAHSEMRGDIRVLASNAYKLALPVDFDANARDRWFVAVDCSDPALGLSCRSGDRPLSIGGLQNYSSVVRDTPLQEAEAYLSNIYDRPLADLRRWRLAELDRGGLVRPGQELCITASSAGLQGSHHRRIYLYGDGVSQSNEVVLPSFHLNSIARTFLKGDQVDMRVRDRPSKISEIALGSTVLSEHGQPMYPRIRLLRVPAASSSAIASVPRFSSCILDLKAHRLMVLRAAEWRKNEKDQAIALSGNGIALSLPEWVHEVGLDLPRLEFVVKGSVRCLQGSPCNHYDVVLEGTNKVTGKPYSIDDNSPYQKATIDWQPFSLRNVIDPAIYAISDLTLRLYPDNAEQLKTMGVTNTTGDFEFKDLQVEIRQLSPGFDKVEI